MILVAGEALIDLLVGADGGVTAVPGGGPFNVARALARLGCPSRFFGRISSDGFGRDLRAALVADGVEHAPEQPVAAPTTLAVARLDTDGVARYTFYLEGTSAGALVPADVGPTTLDGIAALHVGSLGLVVEPMASAVRALVRAAPEPVLVMVDVNARLPAIEDLDTYRASVLDLLRRADVVKVSTDDLDVIVPHASSVPEAADGLVANGAEVVLVTDGPHPIRVFGADYHAEVPARAVGVVDTVGAGDAFGAGFLAWWQRRGHPRRALTQGDLVLEAVARAADVAACTCMRRGADPPVLAELTPAW